MLERILLTLLFVCMAGCRRDVATKTSPSGMLASLPINLTVKQRSTNVVPKSNAKLMLTTDDITGDQVLVSLSAASGRVLLSSISMRQDDRHRFEFESVDYFLTLVELNNALIGEDFATFCISSESKSLSRNPMGEGQRPGDFEPQKGFGTFSKLTEKEKIERLIQFIGSMQGISFVRNGKRYSATEAAKHLRMKWDAAGKSIKTAQQFIDQVASHSSTTGTAYTVTQENGTSIQTAVLLRKQLTDLENGR